MDTPDDPSPEQGLGHRLRRTARRPWPWLAVGAFAVAGGLFVTSSIDAGRAATSAPRASPT